ncbi:hypothetical protein SEA_TYKE_106 [Mycobacterium phage Tyke]|nr:hypothetical protein SEA_TYKE_106 [Mycobacterium phage Tyke]QAX93626.1 hypothetical protein SEA_MELPOMINI_99 [Mycobacterium phage Melpomini]QAY05519.1 hypothetical protein SEA_SMALLFRY_105 [Mycobacterium phage SmallFry]QAY07182.1 hypothetical protein SEA_TORTOISE16_102 [Mycobacterium phage Tortoise16]QAY10792.1 hypothetical protein SEA_SHIALABEOUF_104 [Mycobacterium phage ShiaLabeouf]QAY13816.1 hypothetical protein SEA_ESSENCE_102 [Mycobacterium phage Essence]URP21406.1 hypothetical protei
MRRPVLMRITTAREQFEMLSPWREADVAIRPDAVPPGVPGAGNQPQIPAREKNIGENTPWSQVDWRTADDYGAHRSTSRPPMSSDIPHPTELLDPRKAGHRARLERAMTSEDPVNDPWNVLGGTPWTFEDLVQNHMSHHQNMNPEQEFQGRVWYPAAHDSTKDVAQRTIGDHERTVAVDSALSPVKDWDLNNEQMIHYLTNYEGQEGHKSPTKNWKGFSRDAPERDPENRFRVKAPDDQNEKAHRLMDAPAGSLGREDYLNILSGPKTSSFFNNILDETPLREPRSGVPDDEGFYEHQINPNTGKPDWRYGDQDVTVDTHHARVQTIPHGADLSQVGYVVPDHFGEKLTVNKKAYHPGYDLHARASAEATRRLNAMQEDDLRTLKPKQAQAGPWVKFKKDVVDAGVSPNMPEPGHMPKSFNPDKPTQLRGPYPNTPDQPRYQRDVGDFWVHPDRPDPDLRRAPNWNNRTPSWRSEKNRRQSSVRVGFVEEWIAQHFPHRASGVPEDGSVQQVVQASFSDDFEPIAIHPEPHKIHPDWGGGEPDVEHRGYWRHRPLDMEVMSDWGDENGNISYALNHEGDTLDVAQDPHEFLSRSPQELADMFGLNPETHDDRGHYGSRLTAETLSYVDEVLKNV